MSKLNTARRMATGRIPTKRVRAILARQGMDRDAIAETVRALAKGKHA